MGARRLPHADPPRNHALSGAGVVAALGAEARTLGRPVRRSDGLFAAGDGILMAVSGMGCPAAAAAARRLLDAGATALVSWGMAGGLDPKLTAGTICLPRSVVTVDAIPVFGSGKRDYPGVARLLAARDIHALAS